MALLPELLIRPKVQRLNKANKMEWLRLVAGMLNRLSQYRPEARAAQNVAAS
jgi:hypothetical protein